MAALVLATVFDFIFIFTEIRVWMQNIPSNPVWGQLRPMHNFGLFCFICINILKIILMILIGKGIKDQNKAVQTR